MVQRINFDALEPSDLGEITRRLDELELLVAELGGRVSALEKPPAPEPALAFGAQYTATWPGIDDEIRRKMCATIAGTGAGWVRFDVAWATMQPGPGESGWDLNYGVPLIERCVDIARDAGLKVLMMVYWPPSWASSSKTSAPTPSDYERAMAWIADRFRGRVAAYEIWNEQNNKRFLDPVNPATYAGLLKAGYAGVKASDPDALVVMGGLEYVDTDYLRGMYAAGARGHYDIAACHPYPAIADQPPDTPWDGTKWTPAHLDEWFRVMDEHGDAAPVWLTEFGWSTHANQGGEPNHARGVTDAQQADYLYGMIDLARERWPRIEGFFWYTVRDTTQSDVQQANYGLLRLDGTEKPAVTSLRDAVQWFGS